MKTHIIDQIVRPKVEGGADWSSQRIVLVRLTKDGQAEKEIWWHKAHAYWAGSLGGATSIPAGLKGAKLYDWASKSTEGVRLGGANTCDTHLSEGGRLSKALIASHSEAINAFLGCEVAHLIETKKTLLVEE